ncbi:MAG: hypothetical protein E4H40_01380 [Candidatus Brocadiia bacterium]|nr:MAG: hypothetical protein E4H40_01380 [Candidatus Brocadiia bacterium]
MIELHLENTIIAFDGRVIEAFPRGQAASRYHVANVKTAGILSDRKGRQSLQIFMDGGGGFATAPLSPEAAQQAQTLIAEIQKARPDL